MKLAVVVPFKASDRKSRLATLLTAAERRKLARTMLTDVLRALEGCGLTGSCWVVSSDASVLAEAVESGARPLREPRDNGVNAAVYAAIRRARGADTFMVLPADLPLLRSIEVAAALDRAAAGFGAVVAPSSGFNGTNLLIFPREARFRLSYDSDSFWNHVAEAAKKGLRTYVTGARGLTSDLDTPEDLDEASRSTINSRSVLRARRLTSRRVS